MSATLKNNAESEGLTMSEGLLKLLDDFERITARGLTVRFQSYVSVDQKPSRRTPQSKLQHTAR
jgi:hypothetical protein